MSNVEHGQSEEPFAFTENERLFDRVTTERLLTFINDDETRVHSITLTTNTYGEFLFIETSRKIGESSASVTFWGAGYHEKRERWLTREWFWYRNPPRQYQAAETIEKSHVRETIEARLAEIAVYGDPDRQSKRGMMFEMLADLTDDDGATIDMEDMAQWLADWEEDSDE